MTRARTARMTRSVLRQEGPTPHHRKSSGRASRRAGTSQRQRCRLWRRCSRATSSRLWRRGRIWQATCMSHRGRCRSGFRTNGRGLPSRPPGQICRRAASATFLAHRCAPPPRPFAKAPRRNTWYSQPEIAGTHGTRSRRGCARAVQGIQLHGTVGYMCGGGVVCTHRSVRRFAHQQRALIPGLRPCLPPRFRRRTSRPH